MMGYSRLGVFVLVALATAACNRKTSSPSEADASTAASPGVSGGAAAPLGKEAAAQGKDGPDAGARQVRTYLSYYGQVASQPDVRIALERTGDHLEGVYTRWGEGVPVRGEMKDGERFHLAEVVPKGKKPATIEGKLDGMRLVGTWKDAETAAKVVEFTAGPPAPFAKGDGSFEQSYVGSLGSKIRVRMKLKKSGEKVIGNYRYTKSREDLRLEGTVNQTDGRFELRETDNKGTPTGRFEGVFLERGILLGRWTSPDGARTLPVTLAKGDAYPEAIALSGGAKLVPQEDYKQQGRFCEMSLLYPQIEGLADKNVEKKLDAALRAQAGDSKKMDCELASDELRYETTASYEVEAKKENALLLRYSYYSYAGGAHGLHGSSCYAADLATGTMTPLTAKLLSPASRRKVDALVRVGMQKEHGVEKLSEAGFNSDDPTTSDETTLCVEGSDLVVQFALYEIAPYAMGMQTVHIPPKDAAPLVAGTPLARFFE